MIAIKDFIIVIIIKIVNCYKIDLSLIWFCNNCNYKNYNN